MSDVKRINLTNEEKNRLLVKVYKAQDVTAEKQDDIILHLYFFGDREKYYYKNFNLGELESWEKVQDGIILLEHLDGDRCFFFLNSMKRSGLIAFESWAKVRDDILLLTNSDGYKCFFFLRNMKASNWLVFESYFIDNGVIFLKSKYGSVAKFDTSIITVGPWQFV